MQVCRQWNVSPKFLVHSSAGLWHFKKVQCKSQYWNQLFILGVEYGLQVPVPYRFQWRKTTIGLLHRVAWKKRYRVRLKSIELLQNYKMKSKGTIVVLKYKKILLFEEIDKNVRQVTYFTWGLKFSSKAVSSLRVNCFRDA